MGLVLAAGSAAAADPSAPAVVSGRVTRWEPAEAMVTFDQGRDAGVAPGDLFWVIDDQQVRAAGRIILTAPGQSVGRASVLAGEPAPASPAGIVCHAGLGVHRRLMPDRVTIRGRLTRLPPGRRTGWIDLGSNAGLNEGDRILVRRRLLPIALGTIRVLEAEVALAAMRPLVGNALPEPGDEVELWPAPADDRLGRRTTAVLDVRPLPDGREGTRVILAGSVGEQILGGCLADLFRGETYVGVATVDPEGQTDRLSAANLIEAASALRPQIGDEARVRLRSDPPGPLRVPVFKVEGGGCLLAAGENDGVSIDEKFVVRRAVPGEARMEDIAELTVIAVKVDYCDTAIRPLTDRARVLPWDFAERVNPPWEHWRPMGVVRKLHADQRWFLADIDPGTALQAGDVVRCAGEDSARLLPAAAVVVHAWTDTALGYVPPGWGDPASLTNARIENRRPRP